MIDKSYDNVREVPSKKVADILKQLKLKEHPKTLKEFETRRKQYGVRLGRIK